MGESHTGGLEPPAMMRMTYSPELAKWTSRIYRQSQRASGASCRPRPCNLRSDSRGRFVFFAFRWILDNFSANVTGYEAIIGVGMARRICSGAQK
ncbi:Hypothetical protein NTJ_10404 [Nesidiocoris tenuis]|uniref:Uncharacterized protein n=1 Tax=Nesidiocoris tenuis TaxID=355587 RepID=A0ABN7B325_9HEMI|nr:Hypothetical protein NTJ_10404 [Nesidiocoris tenuis]